MRWLGVILAVLSMTPVEAQDAAAGGLNIVIIEGEGAINNIKQRTARETIVQVEDENHKPIAGAVVVFTTPNQGASGVFADGSHLFTTTTDSSGRAAARGLRLNNTSGRMEMRVTASKDGKTASRTVVQSNVIGVATTAAGLSLTAKLLILLGVAGAAAVGGVVAATSGGGSPSPTPTPPSPTTISIGAPGTVGPPR
jgi:hypothetical protein